MSARIQKYDLKVAAELVDFIKQEALPGLAISADAFWAGLGELVAECGPQNRALLEMRSALQQKIDA